jgi:hypothetical protein
LKRKRAPPGGNPPAITLLHYTAKLSEDGLRIILSDPVTGNASWLRKPFVFLLPLAKKYPFETTFYQQTYCNSLFSVSQADGCLRLI